MKVVIQVYPGSYHDAAANKYCPSEQLELIAADSSDELGTKLVSDKAEIAVMVIENFIAGTILQNYRIIRENDFGVSGEIYLKNKYQTLVLIYDSIIDVKKVAFDDFSQNYWLKENFLCHTFVFN